MTTLPNEMILSRDIFEYWTHAAAFIPIEDFRFSLPYKHAIKSGQTHWYKKPDKKLMNELLARIQSDGAIRSRDLESNTKRGVGWWDWKPAKKALEQLYMQGDIMVSNREGFQKTYDLTERVLPSHINAKMPSIEEFAAHTVKQQLRCHGLVSVKGITYLRRNTKLRQTVKALVEEELAQGHLEQVRINNNETFIVKTGTLEQPVPRLNKRLLIMSPFDNCVIQRERLKALFQYNYQLECYVPAAKRQYGYFSLPLLYHDKFIGRMDCKAHRKIKQLEIKSLHFEPHHFAEEAVLAEFIKSIQAFCHFQQCDTVSLTEVKPKHLGQPLHYALQSLA